MYGIVLCIGYRCMCCISNIGACITWFCMSCVVVRVCCTLWVCAHGCGEGTGCCEVWKLIHSAYGIRTKAEVKDKYLISVLLCM